MIPKVKPKAKRQSLPALIRKADAIASTHIRMKYADSSGVVKCVTCGKFICLSCFAAHECVPVSAAELRKAKSARPPRGTRPSNGGERRRQRRRRARGHRRRDDPGHRARARRPGGASRACGCPSGSAVRPAPSPRRRCAGCARKDGPKPQPDWPSTSQRATMMSTSGSSATYFS